MTNRKRDLGSVLASSCVEESSANHSRRGAQSSQGPCQTPNQNGGTGATRILDNHAPSSPLGNEANRVCISSASSYLARKNDPLYQYGGVYIMSFSDQLDRPRARSWTRTLPFFRIVFRLRAQASRRRVARAPLPDHFPNRGCRSKTQKAEQQPSLQTNKPNNLRR
jgi:hypothetical protein